MNTLRDRVCYFVRLICSILLLFVVILGIPLPSEASDFPPGQGFSGGLPPSGIDIIPMRFDFEIEITSGPYAGEKLRGVNVTDAAAVIGRSNPIINGSASTQAKIDWSLLKNLNVSAKSFADLGISASEKNSVFIPRLTELKEKGIDLPTTLNAFSFQSVPDDFKGPAKLSYYEETGSLKAKSPDGQYALLAGQPLKEKYPQIYKPAGGVAISQLENARIPQRFFFIPYGVFETPRGAFIANSQNFVQPVLGAIKASTDENQTFSRTFTTLGSTGERVPFDIQDEGETFYNTYPQPLTSVDDPNQSVAQINYFAYTNAALTKGIGIFLASPDQQPENATLKAVLGQ